MSLYREERQALLGYKRLGWQRIRDEIMMPFDEYSDERKITESPSLTRQDLENWQAGVSSLSDNKFIFIDKFIREKLQRGEFDRVRAKLIAASEYRAKKALFEMYSSKSLNQSKIDGFFERLQGSVYTATFVRGPFRQAILIFDTEAQFGISLTALLVRDRELRKLNTHDDVGDGSYCMRGFLIPLSIVPRDTPNYSDLKGTIKFFRPEYKGHPIVGYADVSFEANLSTFDSTPHVLDFIISWSHHLLSDLTIGKPADLLESDRPAFPHEETLGEREHKYHSSGSVPFNYLFENHEISKNIINISRDYVAINYKGFIL